jgi:hypothetical protein
MLFYLGWDTYHMITNPILYRTDLMIHHTITVFFTLSSINIMTLQESNYLIIECISLMNYIWRNNPQLLKLYRTLCICMIRTPLSLWFYFYYNPTVLYPYWKYTLTYPHYVYLKTLFDMAIFFAFYDMFILWKLYKPQKLKDK